MSVSSDSDMDYPTQRLEVLTGVVTHIVGPRHITHHEYFFQVHSGTKLPTRITMKASQNRLQSNETTESTFNATTMAKSGKTNPSILIWTRPQYRQFSKLPSLATSSLITNRA